MAMITIKCPTCGENFQADDSREFAFCSYCGAKVEIQAVRDAVLSADEGITSPSDGSGLSEASSENAKSELSENNYKPSVVSGSTELKEQRSSSNSEVSSVKYMSREEFERKKAFERRCSEQIAFFSDQMNKPDKKRVNTREFFNSHLNEWQEALYSVQKELRDVEVE